jgi:serine protease Do
MRSWVLLATVALVAGGATACGGNDTKQATPSAGPSTASATATSGAGAVRLSVAEPQGALTVPQIVEKLAPSIVRVQTETATLDIFGRVQPSQGVGTGVIIDTDGHIVTNNHVVTTGNRDTPADRITVTLSDQRTAEATIVGRDQPTDLAVLKIDLDNLTPAVLGDPDAIQVGQDVVAIGYALALAGPPTVTRGVVSAKDRSIDEPPYTINDALQTDAGINPGNSGGPLVNAVGEVIGINTAVISSAQNIGLAISVGLVKPTVGELIRSGRIERAYLGVATTQVTPAIARNFNLPVDRGIAVTGVGQGTPADDAGIRVGDVIVAIDGQDVANSGDFLAILAKHRAGDRVRVDLYRGSQRRSLDVTLQARPSS